MTHYTCKECSGVAGEEGACGKEGCTKFGEALEACDCAEPGHASAEEKKEE